MMDEILMFLMSLSCIWVCSRLCSTRELHGVRVTEPFSLFTQRHDSCKMDLPAGEADGTAGSSTPRWSRQLAGPTHHPHRPGPRRATLAHDRRECIANTQPHAELSAAVATLHQSVRAVPRCRTAQPARHHDIPVERRWQSRDHTRMSLTRHARIWYICCGSTTALVTASAPPRGGAATTGQECPPERTQMSPPISPGHRSRP